MIGKTRLCAVLLVAAAWLGIRAPVAAQESAPATSSQPASQAWGQAQEGLQLSIRLAQPAQWGGKLLVTAAVRNAGSTPVDLPPPARAACWATVVYGRDKAWITEKLPLDCAAPGEALAPDKQWALGTIELSDKQAYAARLSKALLETYVSGEKDDSLKPDGILRDMLWPGACKLRLTIYFSRPQKGLALQSNTLDLEVTPPELDKLDQDRRKAYLAELRRQFLADAWSGQQAHAQAIKLGPAIVPELIEAVNKIDSPAAGRMWLTTALADIRDARAADALVKLLDDDNAGVRSCVGYHGPKQRSPKLDAAIVAKAKALGEPSFTAYSILGFLVFRKQTPPELMQIGLSSSDARVQIAVKRAMAQYASDYNVSRLNELAGDKDPAVAASAREILQAMGKSPPAGKPAP